MDLPNFKFVRGCIQSFDLVAHILESEEIDTVMHFAAQVSPPPLTTAGTRLRFSCCNIALASQYQDPPASHPLQEVELQP